MTNLGHSSIHRVTHTIVSCNIEWNKCVMRGTAIQTAALESRTSQLVALRIADNTAKVYGSGARAYIRFAMFYRYTPILPASDTLQGCMSHIRGLCYPGCAMLLTMDSQGIKDT